MDRKSYTPGASTTRFRDINRYSQPEKSVDDNIVQKLFLLIEEGDVYKIKDFMIGNDITASVRLDTGETLIYNVIKSSNLRKDTKFDITKFLIQRGAPVALSNKNNITPLHLACKLQYTKIAELLINNGALINATDSQGMTPLHYQVMGEPKSCKTEKTNKIGDIIPSQNVLTNSLDKKLLDNDINNISQSIIDLLYMSPVINQYFVHIKETLENIQNMYPDDLDKIRESYEKDIANISGNSKMLLVDKKQKYLDNISTFKDKINDLLIGKLKDCLSEMNIAPNSSDGWGPDDDPNNSINKVLPYKDTKVIFDELENTKRRQINELSFREQIGKILPEINKMKEFYEWTHDGFYESIRDGIEGITDNNLNIFLQQNLDINKPLLNLNLYAGDNLDLDLSIGLDDINPIGPILISDNQYDVHNQGAQHVVNGGIPNGGFISSSIFKYYLNRLEENISSVIDNTENLLSYLNVESVFYTYHILCTNIIVQMLGAALNLAGMTDGIDLIEKSINQISNSMKLDDLSDAIRRQNYDTAVQFIRNERNGISETRRSIETIYSELLNIMGRLNQTVDLINKISSIRSIKQYFSFPNDIVSEADFNNEDTTNYYELFNRSLLPFALIPTSIVEFRKLLSNPLYDQPIESIEKIKRDMFEMFVPQFTYKNFASYLTDSLVDISVKQLLPDGTTANLDIPIRDLSNNIIRGLPDEGDPLIGFLMRIWTDINNNNDESNMDRTHLNTVAKLPKLKYGNRTQFYPDEVFDPTNLDALVVTADGANPLTDIFGFQGLIAQDPYSKKKHASALPSVGPLLGNHFEIIKYLVIQRVIVIVSTLIDKSEEDIDATEKVLWTTLNNYKENHNKEFDNKISDGIIYTLVGKITDQLIINYIKECAKYTAAKSISRISGNLPKKEFYTDVLENIINPLNTLVQEASILKIDTNFNLSLKDIANDIIDIYDSLPATTEKTISKINYMDLLIEDPEKIDKSQHMIFNYAFNAKIGENKCFKIDLDLTDILIKRGNARVNQKDLIGNTSLVYAIELQHFELIEKLIKNGAAVNNKLAINYYGITPLYHALQIYETHIKIMSGNGFQKLTTKLYDKIIETVRKKPEYKNNIIKYADNIFPQILFMLNHHFYLLSQQYIKSWTRDKQKSLIKRLGMFSLIDPSLDYVDMGKNLMPLLAYRGSFDVTGVNGTQVLNGKIKYLEFKINELTKNISDMTDKQMKSLQEEFNDITDRIRAKPDPYYTARSSEIQKLMNELHANINANITEKDKLERLKNSATTAFNRITPVLATEIDTNSQNIVMFSTGNVVNLYENVFGNIINGNLQIKPHPAKFRYQTNYDLTSYPSLWSKYINDNHNYQDKTYGSHNNNITLITFLLSDYQEKLLDSFYAGMNIKDFYDNLKIVSDFHKNISGSFAKDYEELPNEYNERINYALHTVMGIIIHTIRHSICAMLYNIIVKAIMKFVMSINIEPNLLGSPTATYENDANYTNYVIGVVDAIVGVGNNEPLLMKYILDTMPIKATKIVLGIYESEIDPDRKISKLDSLFDSIVNILLMNDTIPLDKTSSIIVLIQTYIFPYFKDMLEFFISESKNLVDGYLKYLVNEDRQINNVIVLLENA